MKLIMGLMCSWGLLLLHHSCVTDTRDAFCKCSTNLLSPTLTHFIPQCSDGSSFWQTLTSTYWITSSLWQNRSESRRRPSPQSGELWGRTRPRAWNQPQVHLPEKKLKKEWSSACSLYDHRMSLVHWRLLKTAHLFYLFIRNLIIKHAHYFI